MVGLLLAIIYLVFVSLGLPDSLLGSAWPSISTAWGLDSSLGGYISMTICFMTIVSALFSEKLTRKLSVRGVIAISIGLTVAGLFGFSFCTAYWMFFVMAIPYGLGAGSIDAAINNYVATRFSSRVMNFLHCFWGVGAMISPNIMSLALTHAKWNQGYQWVAYIQSAILVIVLLSFPLWNKVKAKEPVIEESGEPVGIKKAIRIPGVPFALVAFFAYSAGEMTAFLWTSTFFATAKEGVSPEMVASFGSLVFGGMMVGRFMAALIANKTSDQCRIRIGAAFELLGIILILIPVSTYWVAAVGFAVFGFGMGPIYPAITHAAPTNFGKKNSAAVIGMQMACAYVGSSFFPTIFGYIGQYVSMWALPFWLLGFAALNFTMMELSTKFAKKHKAEIEKTAAE